MDGKSEFVEAVVTVVVVEADLVMDELIDAINVVLAEGQWDQVVALTLVLREHALRGGNVQLATLVEDIRMIALDALAHPSEDDGVILDNGVGGRD